MWLPHVVTVPPTVAPVPVASALAQCRIDIADAGEADLIADYIAAAVGLIEGQTGTKLAPQTVQISASCWDDLKSFLIGPVQSVSIAYVDTNGDTQTADPATYELTGAGTLAAGIAPVWGASWPAFRPSRAAITVTAEVGYAESAVPPSVKLAALMLVSRSYENRAPLAEIPGDIAALLVNHRIYAF